MPIDQTCSDLKDEATTQIHQKFEWHIIVTESGVTENPTTEKGNDTTISILEKHSHSEGVLLSKSELKQAISKGALWLTPAKNKKANTTITSGKKTVVRW